VPSFEDEIQSATRALGELRRASEQSARGEQQREQQRSAIASFASTSLSTLGNAGARGFGVSGSAEEASGSAFRAGLSAFSSIPILGGLTAGVNDTLEGARSEVLDVTQDYARYGIQMDEGARQRLIDTKLEQNKRMTADRSAVTGEIFTADNAMAAADGSPFASLIDICAQIKASLERITGGSAR
jgi:hypothetical protein